MDAVRAYASERREAAEHRRRVGDHRKLTLLTWDYHNLRIDTLVAPLSVLANVAGLALAVVVASRMGPAGVAAVVVTFAYYVQATKILFDFNQIYRQLERTLTEAAQFAELLLDPPTVLDPESPEPVAHAGASVGARARSVHPRGRRRAAVRRARPAHRRRRAGRSRRPLRWRQDVDRTAAPAADGRRQRRGSWSAARTSPGCRRPTCAG